MNVYKVPVKGYYAVNSYFLIDEDTGHGFLIDPGAQGAALVQIIRSKVWTIEKILLTHGHFDHTGGIEAIRRELNIPVYIHENGATYLEVIEAVRSIRGGKLESPVLPHSATIQAARFIQQLHNALPDR